ncbi:uncharacterized protein LOC110944753 [Helianthus annuus]|uniref:uncharacterized protein LOC110944753 n=1 Tax=Helianthus annuus TaxID=4232 RepID=UPI000B9064FE|nr:uncharacterized protein LOC110944753 [Helianthus annuus]
MWKKIGNGQNTYLWFDKWSNECPLYHVVTPRQLARYGFSVMSKVTEAFINGRWEWPEEWRSQYPSLFQLQPLTLSITQDRVVWKNFEEKLVPFSSREVWDTIRTRDQQIRWSKVIWSAFNIPKHAFMTWLIFKKKLWTQDRILRWNQLVTGSMNLMCCLLCHTGLETHEHLFFECPYSSSVWHKVRQKIDMDMASDSWEDISEWLISRANSKTVVSVAGRLIVAAAAYVIWSERNARFFSNRLRPPEKTADIVISTVRTKLISFKYKQSLNVQRFLEEWKMEKEEFLDED